MGPYLRTPSAARAQVISRVFLPPGRRDDATPTSVSILTHKAGWLALLCRERPLLLPPRVREIELVALLEQNVCYKSKAKLCKFILYNPLAKREMKKGNTLSHNALPSLFSVVQYLHCIYPVLFTLYISSL